MSNKAHVYLSFSGNEQNYCYWDDVNSMALTNDHYIVISDMLCSVGKSNYWSLFFEDENERAVMVNGERL
jgi:hypothetical protein